VAQQLLGVRTFGQAEREHVHLRIALGILDLEQGEVGGGRLLGHSDGLHAGHGQDALAPPSKPAAALKITQQHPLQTGHDLTPEHRLP
jgi:hypothetical protein